MMTESQIELRNKRLDFVEAARCARINATAGVSRVTIDRLLKDLEGSAPEEPGAAEGEFVPPSVAAPDLPARIVAGQPLAIEEATAPEPRGMCRILCTSRRMWWCPNRQGYTSRISEAGLYTREEARRIIDDGDGDDVALRVDTEEQA